ncbi:hypothetical protein ACFXTH_002613 [Malus domestica]
MEIRLSPFQCNKALFVCQNEEEATKIAQLGTLAMNKLPDVVLPGWWDNINSNHRKTVSYDGWVALEGLPPHLWTNNFFQKIGEACGGLVEIDRRTANFGFLLEAKLKLKPNDTGFIPEFVDVADGESVFRTDLKIQRNTGAIPTAKADLQQSVPSPRTRVCFRIGEFECPVTVRSDKKQGLNRLLTDEAQFEEYATPDFTYSISKHETPLQAKSLTESASFTEEPESAEATDYFKNSKRKESLKQMFFSEKGKGLEVCGKVGGGGISTEGAQSSTNGLFERPKMMEIQSPNLTILDSVCELEEEKDSDVDENPVRPPGGSTEKEPFDQRMRWTEALGLDSSHLSDSVEEEYMSQSSDSDEEIGDSSQDEKEPSDVFDCFNGELHNLFIDTNLETKATSEEAPNQTHDMVELEDVEQSDFKDTGKNKKMLKYSRRKRSTCVSVKREAQDQTSKFLSKMKVSLVPLKRSLFHEMKTGKVKVSKSEGGSKGDKKL